jgi:hypothetical protein
MDHSNGEDAAPPGFWENVSAELFDNVWELYESIDTFFSMRAAEDGFPAMLVGLIYSTDKAAS